MLKYNLITLLFIFLFACSAKKSNLTSESNDKKFKLNLSGTKASSLDPWIVNFYLKAEGFDNQPVNTEIYASELSSETVKFNWQSNTRCIISITQTDNTVRKFICLLEPNRVFMKEM